MVRFIIHIKYVYNNIILVENFRRWNVGIKFP